MLIAKITTLLAASIATTNAAGGGTWYSIPRASVPEACWKSKTQGDVLDDSCCALTKDVSKDPQDNPNDATVCQKSSMTFKDYYFGMECKSPGVALLLDDCAIGCTRSTCVHKVDIPKEKCVYTIPIKDDQTGNYTEWFIQLNKDTCPGGGTWYSKLRDSVPTTCWSGKKAGDVLDDATCCTTAMTVGVDPQANFNSGTLCTEDPKDYFYGFQCKSPGVGTIIDDCDSKCTKSSCKEIVDIPKQNCVYTTAIKDDANGKYTEWFIKLNADACPTNAVIPTSHVWDGTFTGTHLHKSLQVCVDCDGNTCYGQGLADERAYFRGTITDAQGISTWTGTYYEPGKGSTTGKFTLKLDTQQGKYTGTLTSSHKRDFSSDSTVSGTRTANTVPTNAECFRADLDYVKDDTKGFVNGWIADDDYLYYYKAFGNNAGTFSYEYKADGQTFKGTQLGNCYVGTTQQDICTMSFYELGSREGISLLVAKNATHQYETWFQVASLGEFDPTHIEDTSGCNHNEHSAFLIMHDTSKSDETLARSTKDACYIQWTEALEKLCQERSDLPKCTEDGARRLDSGCVDEKNGAQCISVPVTTKTTTVPGSSEPEPEPEPTTAKVSGAKLQGLMLTLGLGAMCVISFV